MQGLGKLPPEVSTDQPLMRVDILCAGPGCLLTLPWPVDTRVSMLCSLFLLCCATLRAACRWLNTWWQNCLQLRQSSFSAYRSEYPVSY